MILITKNLERKYFNSKLDETHLLYSKYCANEFISYLKILLNSDNRTCFANNSS